MIVFVQQNHGVLPFSNRQIIFVLMKTHDVGLGSKGPYIGIGVGVNTNKKISFIPISNVSAFVERKVPIIFAGIDNFHSGDVLLNVRAQLQSDLQRDILFLHQLAGSPVVLTTMPGVNDDDIDFEIESLKGAR
jgi:hypothetical protein